MSALSIFTIRISTGDPNSIKKGALLGFSLDVIDCDSNEEFQSRVGNNNYIDPADPNHNRIQVERVVGLEPRPQRYYEDEQSGGCQWSDDFRTCEG